MKEEVEETSEIDVKEEPLESQTSVKRGVAKQEDEDEEEDIFAEVKEEDDDKEDVKAAIQSGLYYKI